MADGYGDRLARGSSSASFGIAPQLTQDQWDAMWAEPEAEKANASPNSYSKLIVQALHSNTVKDGD